MKKFLAVVATLTFLVALAFTPAMAGKPVDGDNDGYKSRVDCNDSDPLINPGAAEICGDGIDNNCDGLTDSEDTETCGEQPVCSDGDGDGYGAPASSACSFLELDCNDSLFDVNPGATEICGNGIDDNCNDAIDEGCGGGTDPNHGSLTWSDYPTACLGCHGTQFNEMANATHYKWVGDTTEMTNQNGTQQGKLTNAVNSYCINILGDWKVCGKCHAGRGLEPNDPLAGQENIDCLVCHNEAYALARTRVGEGAGSMTPPVGLDSYVQNISTPTPKNCLKCHAYAGGANAVKRGDLSMSDDTHEFGTDNTIDENFDVHMNNAGAGKVCQECHVFQNHKTIGRGSDLRPTDDLARGSEVKCSTCHTGFDVNGGHAAAGANRTDADRHVARVACQSCHIDKYAKTATETHRDWRMTHDGLPADGTNGFGHPYSEKAAILDPVYKFWNRSSYNYLLGDTAVVNPETGFYSTSLPVGDINSGKLYPFKHKTAVQPMVSSNKNLISVDTLVYLTQTSDADFATKAGLVNMGYSADEPYEWVTTDTYGLLNHGVATAAKVDCAKCHQGLDVDTDSELDLLGYKLKGSKSAICSQCHREKNLKSDTQGMHNHLNKGDGMDCLFCHDFSRQSERGGISPCDSNASDFVDNVPFPHTECSQ